MSKFNRLYNKILKENENTSVEGVIKSLEFALAPFDESGEQAALEELEYYGAPLKTMSNRDKMTVVHYFENQWSDVPFIAQMIKDYAFNNYSAKKNWYIPEPVNKK